VREQCYLKGPRESLEPFDRDPTAEILRVTWRDVQLGNEPGFRLLKIRVPVAPQVLGLTPRGSEFLSI
jgi:hypothetical protein